MRFRQRHVQQTIVDFYVTQMTNLGWVGASVPFGSPPLRFVEADPEEMPAVLTGTTLAISMGDEDSDDIEEMGGGFYSVTTPVFLDVYAEKHAIAVAIASDVKELITRGKQLKVMDWSSGVGVETTDYIEFENVVGPIKPESAAMSTGNVRRHWRVVKAMAVVYYTPDGIWNG